MRVFLTGATGFIGSALVPELLAAGHQVLGLTRSEEGAKALAAAGAEAHFGTLEDLETLHDGAAACDAVIHTAFDHDFAKFAENCEKDSRVIAAMGAALEGSGRPFVITSVTALGTVQPGQPAVEDHFDAAHRNPRVATERAGRALLRQGVKVSFVRLSQIHDTRKQGLVTYLIDLARRTGTSAYLGEGANGWSAAHLSDTASLYRLALEKQGAGDCCNATAEAGVRFRDIAEAIGRRLDLPVRDLDAQAAADHFGWLALFVGHDMSASSALTRARLGWRPSGPGLLDDIAGLQLAAV